MPGVGELAPDFSLVNQDNKTVRLTDFRGRKVIIFAFPQAFTANCNAQACAFRDNFPKVEARNAVVLGISPDKPETLKRWKEAYQLPYDLLSDPDHKVLQAWGAWGKPLIGPIKLPRALRSYWVIDNNGRVVDVDVGVDPVASIEVALRAIGVSEYPEQL
jgi:peroxiredoxin Q/BCP